MLFELLSLLAEPDPLEAVRIEATLSEAPLEAGATASIAIEFELPEGFSASGSGVPAPILQIDPSASVRPAGERVTAYRALASNEFLDQPYERLLSELPASVELSIDAAPGEDETLGLIFTAYVDAGEEHGKRFLRRRLELPLSPGASAQRGDDADSSWGPADDQRLAIGEAAPALQLPSLFEGRVDFGEARGDGWQIVSTYRAFW